VLESELRKHGISIPNSEQRLVDILRLAHETGMSFPKIDKALNLCSGRAYRVHRKWRDRYPYTPDGNEAARAALVAMGITPSNRRERTEAKAAQSEIRCAICGQAGVADLADSAVFFTSDGAKFVHVSCAIRTEARRKHDDWCVRHDDPSGPCTCKPPSIRRERVAE
jgi:hypothetical protein